MFVLRIEDTDLERSSWRHGRRASSTACAGSGSTGTRGRRSAARTPRTFSPSGSIAIARWPTGSSRRARAYYCYCTTGTSCRQKREAARRPAAPGNTIAPACALRRRDRAREPPVATRGALSGARGSDTLRRSRARLIDVRRRQRRDFVILRPTAPHLPAVGRLRRCGDGG